MASGRGQSSDIHTLIREGQQAQRDGNQYLKEAKFLAALELLVNNYEQAVRRRCRTLLGGSEEDIKDVAQEVLLAAWKGFSGFEFEATISTWLYSITTNKCLNKINERDKASPSLYDAEPLDLPDPNPLPDAILQHREFLRIVEECLDQLPPIPRVVLVMRLLQEQSYKEIAKALSNDEFKITDVYCRQIYARTYVNLLRMIKNRYKDMVGEEDREEDTTGEQDKEEKDL